VRCRGHFEPGSEGGIPDAGEGVASRNDRAQVIPSLSGKLAPIFLGDLYLTMPVGNDKIIGESPL